MKYIATTNVEHLLEYHNQGYTIIGVDGTVPGAEMLYTLLFDHHREGGALIQMDEIDRGLLAHKLPEKTVIVTTMVDADAIASALFLTKGYELTAEQVDFMRAVSFDCDHLAVPRELSYFGGRAAMIVAALKQEGFKLATTLGLPSNRREWTAAQKYEYNCACFEQGVALLEKAIKGEWDYAALCVDYKAKMDEQSYVICKNGWVEYDRGFAIFRAEEFEEYVDPRVWLRQLDDGGLDLHPVTLTVRKYQGGEGYSYTIGIIPFHPKLAGLNFNRAGLYEALSAAERAKNPEAQSWGGRATVGGSPWNTPSQLSPTKVITILTQFV